MRQLEAHEVQILSTGGTHAYIQSLGIPVREVEDLTGMPSILDGRVKTLHPKIFGGILARREDGHLSELSKFDIPEIDMVVVDLYPFEKTVASTKDESTIIEKIDIGGISLIRAAAKNYNDVVVVASQEEYGMVTEMLEHGKGCTSLPQRRVLSSRAFAVTSHYDAAIFQYFAHNVGEEAPLVFKKSIPQSKTLRYGENPHQGGTYFGPIEDIFDIYGGKELSYNNLVDIDAAMNLMSEFLEDEPTFAILKHTNACGVATRPTLLEAWKDALACDSVSAFGGIFICNKKVDLATAQEINSLFYEVILAPDFDQDARELLLSKKGRIVIRIKHFNLQRKKFKSLLNGVIEQDADLKTETAADLRPSTNTVPNDQQIKDLIFAIKCSKHIKSNSVTLVKNGQLIGMGSGQTSRVDALMQALHKCRAFGFDPAGSVMASEAFFPFADCVQIAHEAGIVAVSQPGGSINDQKSIDYCIANGLAMVMTGTRHFLH